MKSSITNALASFVLPRVFFETVGVATGRGASTKTAEVPEFGAGVLREDFVDKESGAELAGAESGSGVGMIFCFAVFFRLADAEEEVFGEMVSGTDGAAGTRAALTSDNFSSSSSSPDAPGGGDGV